MLIFAPYAGQETKYFININQMEEVEIKNLDPSEKAKLGIDLWPIWTKETSKFDWTYDDVEDCFILEGEVIITTENRDYHLYPGNFVSFRKGLKCNWNILKPIKKHYNFR
jgi:hypothetical protein